MPTPIKLPPDHPQRFELHDEVHARPPEPLIAPLRISYIALLSEQSSPETLWQAAADLARHFASEGPKPGANHFSADLGPFRVKWERHTEFCRYTFFALPSPEASDDPFALPAICEVPAEWIATLPGSLLYAAHIAYLPESDVPFAGDHDTIAAKLFSGNVLAGAAIGAGAGTVFTDFRIQSDGFNRLLILNRSMAARQAGRMVQRLLEIDTYRLMALLALPVAREVAPFLTKCEQELAGITEQLVGAGEEEEPILLDRLTRLEASIESRYATSHYRFGAAVAYYELLQRRTRELREERLPGLQTFQEFSERRLAPAMNTCLAVANRLETLSQRITRVTQLLSTRVDITHERQNQAVLEQMNRRAKLQLRLQETVEGLSVAAITYYIVGLFGYLAKAVKAAGLPLNPDIATGVSIPIVIVAVALGVRHIRKMIAPPPKWWRFW